MAAAGLVGEISGVHQERISRCPGPVPIASDPLCLGPGQEHELFERKIRRWHRLPQPNRLLQRLGRGAGTVQPFSAIL